MNSTHRTSAAALAAALATAALVVPVATARQGGDPAQADMRASAKVAQSGPREITVRLRSEDFRVIRHRKGKLRLGDVYVDRQKMFDAGDKPIGHAYLDCVNVGPKRQIAGAMLQCKATYAFADGQLIAMGVVRTDKTDEVNVAIVGGSGAYRGAGGQLNAGTPVKGYDSVDVLKLDG